MASESEHRDEWREPWTSPLSGLQDAVREFVEGFRDLDVAARGRDPRLETVRTPDEYWVLVDLPGVAAADVDVSTEGAELTISGVRSRPAYPEGSEVRRSERAYGRFRRSLHLEPDADVSGIGARLESGVLHLRLPRRSAAGGRKIDIETP